ncbi:5095_t:CDS:2 [Acaulospora morrowiae]|uniref:5095_t:CDS:1 n=1 Tax=Acaulospora morrowiae TaxID=94023 RepID=A0A9N8VH03_9GLOM|nr:5095_t:CDS:2 [Acaulospora morrowiae]
MVNASIEKSAVQVVLRIRPITEEDLTNLPSRFQKNVLSISPSPSQVTVNGEKKQTYTFDRVFGPETTQKEIYDQTVQSMVEEKFMKGYNVTILAYGQTSSGKTHTMGTAHDDSFQAPDARGIIPRSMDTLFSQINSTKYKNYKFSINVSFVEIHNEDLIDLFAEGDFESKPQLMIREDANGNIICSGLREINVNNVEDVMNYLSRGSSSRHVGTTDMNSKSSRSHAIFSVTLSQQKLDEEGNDNITITSKLHFVDLAGSERLKRTSAIGNRVKEGICINSGLLALGNVISALSDPTNNPHIPYRDSKLTRLLQDSLGGNAQTLMIACVTPADYNVSETTNTLKYASRTRNIKNNAKINKQESGWQDIDYLQRSVLKLRAEIKALRTSNGVTGSGRNTPMSETNELDRSLSPLSMIPDLYSIPEKDQDVLELEEKLLELKNSYAELNGKHSKAFKDLEVLKNNIVDGSFDASLNGEPDPQHFNSVKDVNKVQESIKPIMAKYDETIGGLEKDLIDTRKATSNMEKLMKEQESKVSEAEQDLKRNVKLIDDLKRTIQNYNERSETTDEYIKDLEARLNSSSDDKKKNQEMINELEGIVNQISADEEKNDLLIQNLEAQLKLSDSNYSEINKTAQSLEKALHDAADAYVKLEEKYKKEKTSEEEDRTLWLEEIKDRDERIVQLLNKVENLINEIAQTKKLKEEAVKFPLNQQSSPPQSSPILDSHSKRMTVDYSRVSYLESQIYGLQKVHEDVISEFLEIKQRYQYCQDEANDLRAKLQRNSSDEYQTDHEVTTSRSSHRKSRSMRTDDAIKKEFARLEISHRDTLEIMEELREEIKRRDGMAQVEVMSVMTASECGYVDDDHSVVNSDVDMQEIVSRLREEVEQLKGEQKRLLDILSDNQNGHKGDQVLEIESQINQLKIEMSQAISEREKLMDEDSANQIRSTIMVLEDQLIKKFEAKRKAQVAEAVSCLGDDSSYPTEFDDKMLEIRQQINKLDLEIESKSHTIAALLFPSIEHQNVVNKLEDELFDVKESYQLALATKNRILNSNPGESVNIEIDEKRLKEMEEKVHELEIQLNAAKETSDIPTPRRNSLMLLLDTPTHKIMNGLEVQLSNLQSKLKSEEDSQDEQGIVTFFQDQLESLKTALQQKSELIDLLKEDLEEKNPLRQRLREKEAEALSYRTKLMEIHNKDTELQNEMEELRSWLQKLESGENLNKVIESELQNLKRELIQARSRETATLERLKSLKNSTVSTVEEAHLQEQIEKLRSIEVAQREHINALESRLVERGDQIGDDLMKLKIELGISEKSLETQKSIIESLEEKLRNAEDKTQIATIKQEINDLKTRETENLYKIRLLEDQLRESDSKSLQQIEKLNEEIEKLRDEREEQKQLNFLQNRLELIQDENPDIDALKALIDKLKIFESELQKTLQDLETKYVTVQKEVKIKGMIKEELKFLKELDFGHKSTIEQLRSQIEKITKSKDIAVKELSTIKGGFNLQVELVNSLKEEVKNLRQELVSVKYDTTLSTEEFDKASESLDNTRKQYDNALKRIKELETELETCEGDGTTKDEKTEAIRSELISAKLGIVKQNELLVEYETQMKTFKEEQVQRTERTVELTRMLEGREINQKDVIKKLESTAADLEKELLMISSSNMDNEKISKFKEIIDIVKTQLEEAKFTDEKRVTLIHKFESNLKELTKTILSNEPKIRNEDDLISELDGIIQQAECELEMSQTSEPNLTGRIRKLESQLMEVISKQNSTSSENIEFYQAELEKAKASTIESRKKIKELKTKIRNAKTRRDAEHKGLKLANDQAYSIKEECTRMQNEIDDAKYNSVLDCYNSNDDPTVQQLICQIKQEHSNIKAQKIRIAEIEKSNHYLESDKIMQIEHNDDLEEELDQLQKDIETLSDEFADEASKFEDVDRLSKQQKLRIAELEASLEETRKLNLEIQSGESTDPTINKLLIANKELQQTYENLNSKIVDSEKMTSSLSDRIKTLENEIVRIGDSNESLTKNLRVQIKELEFEREHLNSANRIILEEREVLDKRIAFLREQLRMTGSDETQIVKLNDLVDTLEKKVSSFKQDSADRSESLEQEFVRLLEANDRLEQEYKNSSQKTDDDSNPSTRSAAIINNEAITENDDIIKSLKEKLSRLESQYADNHAEQNRLSVASNSSKKSVHPKNGNNDSSRPSTPSSITPLSPRPGDLQKANIPNPPSPRTGHSRINTPTSPLAPKSRRGRSESNVTSSGEFSQEMQNLQMKISKIDNDNMEYKSHAEALEANIQESGLNLRVACDQLSILQKEKQEFIETIKSLKSKLEETQLQLETAKNTVEVEHRALKIIVEEEKKAKLKAERARNQLENQMEQLTNKKKRFMCF